MLSLALLLLAACAAAYTAHVTVGLGGSSNGAFWSEWLYLGIMGASSVLCLMRARTGGDRRAWAAMAWVSGSCARRSVRNARGRRRRQPAPPIVG